MSEAKPITVHILDREFHVMSPDGESDRLLDAARFLDKRMREIRGSGRVVGVERIAVMAALNLAFEMLFGEKDDSQNIELINQRLQKIQDDIESALESNQQLELT